jgi:hypothetical protein
MNPIVPLMLETARLRLRLFEEHEREALHEMFSDEACEGPALPQFADGGREAGEPVRTFARLLAPCRKSIWNHERHGTHRLCGARRSRLVMERLLLDGLDEVQLVAVQVADAELSCTVEHVLDILLELDAFVCASLTSKRSLRR